MKALIDRDAARQRSRAEKALGIKSPVAAKEAPDGSAKVKKKLRPKRAFAVAGRPGAGCSAKHAFRLPEWARDRSVLVDTLGIVGHHTTEGKAEWTALFRQHWKDFCVTEMAAWGEPLSRVPNDELPPIPTGFISASDIESPRSARPQRLEDLSVRTDQPAAVTEAQLRQSHHDIYTRTLGRREEDGSWFLECYLHKQHVPHAIALATVARLLHVPLRSISTAGIKDFMGDTIQRIRIRGVSAGAAVAVNHKLEGISRRNRSRLSVVDGGVPKGTEVKDDEAQRRSRNRFRARYAPTRRRIVELLPDATIRLSHFSYVRGPLAPGHLAGNHFRIVLRDVTTPNEEVFKAAVSTLSEKGCANYYGSQRFSWFRGLDDPGFAVMQTDAVRFCFGVLDFTEKQHSLRELLQRRRVFPAPFQNDFRHRMIRGLKRREIEPADLDLPRFQEWPPVGHMLNGILNPVETSVISTIREVIASLADDTNFHLVSVRVPCLLWNLAVSVRRSLYGDRVFVGDFVLKPGANDAVLDGPPTLAYEAIEVVTEATLPSYTVFDVLHPAFSFHAQRLPDNVVKDIYLALCAEYGVDWNTNYSRAGFPGLIEGPRRIAIRPGLVKSEYNHEARTAIIEFALPRGSYATIALRELMLSKYCAGQPDLTRAPLSATKWDHGVEDPAYIETFEDIYQGIDPVTGDELATDAAEIMDYQSPSLVEDPGQLSFGVDPAETARRFGERNFVHSLEARERATKEMMKGLFEEQLSESMPAQEQARYTDHHVPLRANSSRRLVESRIKKRQRSFAGSPVLRAKVKMGQPGRRGQRSSFERLYKARWNFN